ncbi:MAG: monovalent cation/H+ antiporter complex subunit F [Bdellovibrionia bacterium]
MTTFWQMTVWEWMSLLLLLSLIPCGCLCFMGKTTIDRVIGLQMASAVEVMILMLLSQSSGQGSFFDIALCLTILAFGGGFVFVRFLERWC